MNIRTFAVVLSTMGILALAACKSDGGTGGGGGAGAGSQGGGGSGAGSTCSMNLCADAITFGGTPCDSPAYDDLSSCASSACSSDCAGDFAGDALSGPCATCLQSSCSTEYDACSNEA